MSTVRPPSTAGVLREHVERTRALERSGSIWIYVGTIGVDGVDSLITPDSPVFENGWTNALGEQAPVAFTRLNGWVFIRGGFTGGADGTVIFTLPVGYRPPYQQPYVIPTGAMDHYATTVIGTDGGVIFGTTV